MKNECNDLKKEQECIGLKYRLLAMDFKGTKICYIGYTGLFCFSFCICSVSKRVTGEAALVLGIFVYKM